MTLGNVLTIISIIITIFSFAYSSNRKIIFYKFTFFDIIISLAALLAVSYFLMFPVMYANNIYVDCLVLNDNKYLKPDEWAYLIAISFLFYVGYKAFISKKIPSKNKSKLFEYYNELIHENIPLLISCLRSYHSSEIEKSISKLNEDLNEKEEKLDEQYNFGHTIKIPKLSYKNKISIFSILFNRDFIYGTIEKQYTFFFLETVHNLINPNLDGYKEAVEYYYRTLINSRNSKFTRAILHTENFMTDTSYTDVAYKLNEYQFCNLTFSNPSFCVEMKVWRSFGEEGLKDAQTSILYQRQVSEWMNVNYKESPAYICLSFYNILVRQIIFEYLKNQQNKKNCYIYIYYLYLICDGAITNVLPQNYKNSYAEKLLGDTKSVFYNLLKIQVKNNVDLFLNDIFAIFKSFIYISELSEGNKIELATWIIESYFDLDNNATNVNMHLKLKNGLEDIVNVSSLIMEQGWNQRDVAKYDRYPQFEYIKSLFV